MQEKTTKGITYFKYCGEVNTREVLEIVKKRSEELGITTIIIAS